MTRPRRPPSCATPFRTPSSASEAEVGPDRLQTFDHVFNVLIKWHADLVRALGELVAGDLSREALVLHLLRDRSHVDLIQAAIRPNQRNRDDEAAHLVARVHGACQVRRARYARVIAMAQHRLDELLGVAAGSKLVGTRERVLVRKAFVVEVMQEARRPPAVELIAGLAEAMLAVPGDCALDRPTVLAQRITLRPLAQQIPRLIA